MTIPIARFPAWTQKFLTERLTSVFLPLHARKSDRLHPLSKDMPVRRSDFRAPAAHQPEEPETPSDVIRIKMQILFTKTAVSEIGNPQGAIKPQVFERIDPDARRLMVAIATKFLSGNMTKNLYIPPPTKKPRYL